MARIEAITSCLVRLPLEHPTSFAGRTVTAREYLLVRIQADDGVAGVGFCYPGNLGGALALYAVRDLLAPLLTGEDTHRVSGLWEQMYRQSQLHGRAGVVMRALSALDIALWDHNAQAARQPLYKFLGAHGEGAVPGYASGGYYLQGKTPALLGEELAGYVSLGFKAVKIKVGLLGLKEEAARMAAAREAIGPDVLLMLDATNAWRDLPTALRYMAQCYEPYDPYWIEEPFGPDDIANHARLARMTRVPVATGEVEAGRWRFLELMQQEAAPILQPDAQVCGGVTEYRRIAATAESFGLPLCPHAFHDLHKHLAAAHSNTPFVEVFTDNSILNFPALLDRPSVFRDGQVLLGDAPGLGFDYDEQVVAQHALIPWAQTP